MFDGQDSRTGLGREEGSLSAGVHDKNKDDNDDNNSQHGQGWQCNS